MNRFLNDETRAMLLAFLPDIWTVAVLAGADIGAEGQAAISSLVTKLIVLFFYLMKSGQAAAPADPQADYERARLRLAKATGILPTDGWPPPQENS